MISLPKNDQCCAVFTTVRPVTQVAEADVNKLSRNGVKLPSADDKGKLKSTPPENIKNKNPSTSICVGLRLSFNLSIFSP